MGMHSGLGPEDTAVYSKAGAMSWHFQTRKYTGQSVCEIALSARHAVCSNLCSTLTAFACFYHVCHLAGCGPHPVLRALPGHGPGCAGCRAGAVCTTHSAGLSEHACLHEWADGGVWVLHAGCRAWIRAYLLGTFCAGAPCAMQGGMVLLSEAAFKQLRMEVMRSKLVVGHMGSHELNPTGQPLAATHSLSPRVLFGIGSTDNPASPSSNAAPPIVHAVFGSRYFPFSFGTAAGSAISPTTGAEERTAAGGQAAGKQKRKRSLYHLYAVMSPKVCAALQPFHASTPVAKASMHVPGFSGLSCTGATQGHSLAHDLICICSKMLIAGDPAPAEPPGASPQLGLHCGWLPVSSLWAG